MLTSGGHNAGIVNPPGNPRRRYQVATRPANGGVPLADEWQASAPLHEGSWWPEWLGWLKSRSGDPINPPSMGAPRKGYKPLEDAPGQYVHEK